MDPDGPKKHADPADPVPDTQHCKKVSQQKPLRQRSMMLFSVMKCAHLCKASASSGCVCCRTAPLDPIS
jgi:hypothetical protein